MTAAFTLFDTAIGRCGIAWRGPHIAAFALPEPHQAATVARLARTVPGAEPATPSLPVADCIAAVQALLSGEPADLTFISIDLDRASDFDRRVYEAVRRVGPGRTTTYGQLAAEVGSPGAARAVGVAMARNPVPVIIPCHRVLAGGGRSGGFSAPGGTVTKFRLLEIEGAGREGETLLFGNLPLQALPPRT